MFAARVNAAEVMLGDALERAIQTWVAVVFEARKRRGSRVSWAESA